MDKPLPALSPWWTPHVHADRRPFLIGRNRIQAALRRFFDSQDFVEVDTATLQASPGNEAHLHAFATEAVGPDGARVPLYLHTSPEFACKKLLAAGETRLACFAHVYRNRERGPLHHPEFTMLEWYRAKERYEAVIADCLAVVARAAEIAGTQRLTWRGASADAFRGASGAAFRKVEEAAPPSIASNRRRSNRSPWSWTRCAKAAFSGSCIRTVKPADLWRAYESRSTT